MSWQYYNSVSEIDPYNITIRNNSAWTGHRKFAYDLVRFLKPNLIVELGTYYGYSFFSFCQAVKEGGLPTRCFAVDTWKGDPHNGYYGRKVYHIVKDVVDKYYPNIATMIPAKFDEAVNLFQDQTIDILHIDGFHTLEAVTHDYDTWLPKIAKNGVVLFHDIAVKRNGFGVYLLWDSLKKQFPSIEFEHSFGLGVLFPNGYSKDFEEVFQKAEEFQKIYNE